MQTQADLLGDASTGMKSQREVEEFYPPEQGGSSMVTFLAATGEKVGRNDCIEDG